jgi:hypothetical protein
VSGWRFIGPKDGPARLAHWYALRSKLPDAHGSSLICDYGSTLDVDAGCRKVARGVVQPLENPWPWETKLPKARVTLPLTTVGRRVGREVYTKRQLMTLSAYEATARNEAFIASRCVRFILDLTSLGVITGHPHRCVSVMLTFPLPRAPVRIATASGG